MPRLDCECERRIYKSALLHNILVRDWSIDRVYIHGPYGIILMRVVTKLGSVISSLKIRLRNWVFEDFRGKRTIYVYFIYKLVHSRIIEGSIFIQKKEKNIPGSIHFLLRALVPFYLPPFIKIIDFYFPYFYYCSMTLAGDILRVSNGEDRLNYHPLKIRIYADFSSYDG